MQPTAIIHSVGHALQAGADAFRSLACCTIRRAETASITPADSPHLPSAAVLAPHRVGRAACPAPIRRAWTQLRWKMGRTASQPALVWTPDARYRLHDLLPPEGQDARVLTARQQKDGSVLLSWSEGVPPTAACRLAAEIVYEIARKQTQEVFFDYGLAEAGPMAHHTMWSREPWWPSVDSEQLSALLQRVNQFRTDMQCLSHRRNVATIGHKLRLALVRPHDVLRPSPRHPSHPALQGREVDTPPRQPGPQDLQERRVVDHFVAHMPDAVRNAAHQLSSSVAHLLDKLDAGEQHAIAAAALGDSTKGDPAAALKRLLVQAPRDGSEAAALHELVARILIAGPPTSDPLYNPEAAVLWTMKAIDDVLQVRPWQKIDAENAFVGAIMLAKHRELHAEPGAAAHHAVDYRRLIHHVKDPETAHALEEALGFARKPVVG